MNVISSLDTLMHIFYPLRYEQPSGYRPAPADLSQVFVSSAHEEVVNMLAENDHNVWARERIKQGWTYGAQQVYVAVLLHWSDTPEEELHLNNLFSIIIL